jgi:hypothetical protein
MSRPIVIVVVGFAGAYLARCLERGLSRDSYEHLVLACGMVVNAGIIPGEKILPGRAGRRLLCRSKITRDSFFLLRFPSP